MKFAFQGIGSHISDCSGDTVTLTWQNIIDQSRPVTLSAVPPLLNCDPVCTADPSTSQFTFVGVEAEVRYNLTLRAYNSEGAQEQAEQSFVNVYIPSEYASD